MLSDLSLLCFSPQDIILTKLLIKLNCICRDLKISKLQSSFKLLREGVDLFGDLLAFPGHGLGCRCQCLTRGLDQMTSRGSFQPHPFCE